MASTLATIIAIEQYLNIHKS